MAAGARYFCTAGRGLEPFLAREVRARLGATEVRAALPAAATPRRAERVALCAAGAAGGAAGGVQRALEGHHRVLPGGDG